MSGTLLWAWYAFDTLGTQQLYEVLGLRQSVFILEFAPAGKVITFKIGF